MTRRFIAEMKETRVTFRLCIQRFPSRPAPREAAALYGRLDKGYMREGSFGELNHHDSESLTDRLRISAQRQVMSDASPGQHGTTWLMAGY